MSKKIVIDGKEYLRKNLTKLLVASGKAVTISDKEAVAYDSGIVIISMNDGSKMVTSTNSAENTRVIVFYEGNDVREHEILFGDDDLDVNWRDMYVYFFDDEGAYLLLANRDLLNVHGAYFESVGMNHRLYLRQKALNIAALFGTDIVNKIQNMDLSMAKDFSLLEVAASGWTQH
jgi:hypothetical protein